MTPSRIAYVIGTTAGGTGRHAAMLARDAATVLRLRRLLARQAPDIVHAHGLRAGAITALALARAPRRQFAAMVVTVHNAAPSGVAPRAFYRALERLAAQRADAVLCVSADLADRMRRAGAPDVALAVVPAPPAAAPSSEAVAKARADLGAAGAPVVLAVGRLAAQKGFDVLIEAMTVLRDRDPAPLLVVAGDGPLAAQLARRSRAAGGDVRFLGPRTDIPALLAAADVIAVPSRWEGQPLIVQEALRAGRPLVASRVGGIPDLTGEDAALLVPPDNPARLASAILAVLDDPALASALRAAAVARAGTLPSVPDAVDAAISVYGRLASAADRRGIGMRGRRMWSGRYS